MYLTYSLLLVLICGQTNFCPARGTRARRSVFKDAQTLVANIGHVQNISRIKGPSSKVHLVDSRKVEPGTTGSWWQKDTQQDFRERSVGLCGALGRQPQTSRQITRLFQVGARLGPIRGDNEATIHHDVLFDGSKCAIHKCIVIRRSVVRCLNQQNTG